MKRFSSIALMVLLANPTFGCSDDDTKGPGNGGTGGGIGGGGGGFGGGGASGRW